jgi:hypothetical protein
MDYKNSNFENCATRIKTALSIFKAGRSLAVMTMVPFDRVSGDAGLQQGSCCCNRSMIGFGTLQGFGRDFAAAAMVAAKSALRKPSAVCPF